MLDSTFRVNSVWITPENIRVRMEMILVREVGVIGVLAFNWWMGMVGAFWHVKILCRKTYQSRVWGPKPRFNHPNLAKPYPDVASRRWHQFLRAVAIALEWTRYWRALSWRIADKSPWEGTTDARIPLSSWDHPNPPPRWTKRRAQKQWRRENRDPTVLNDLKTRKYNRTSL